MNNAKLALSTLASTAQTSAAPMIEKLTGKIQELTKWFTLSLIHIWFDSKKMQQYFNVEIEEKAAVAACASDFFEKYNNIPEALKGIDTKDICLLYTSRCV